MRIAIFLLGALGLLAIGSLPSNTSSATLLFANIDLYTTHIAQGQKDNNPAADQPKESKLSYEEVLTLCYSKSRGEALRGLQLLPALAPAAVDPRIKQMYSSTLRNSDARVRAAACLSLGELSHLAPAYRSYHQFDFLLDDSDKTVKLAAMEGLGTALSTSGFTNTYSPETIRLLVYHLNDKDEEIRYAAYTQLIWSGEKELLRRTGDNAACAVPSLLMKLESESPDQPDPTRASLLSMAITTLGKVGRHSATTVPALIKLYARFPDNTKRDNELRVMILNALDDIAPYDETSLPFLYGLVPNDKLPLVERTRAARTIARFGPRAKRYVTDMIDLLGYVATRQQLDREIQLLCEDTVLGALVLMNDGAEPAIPGILNLVDKKNDDAIRISAIRTLGRLAHVSREKALPVLASLLFKKDNEPHETDSLLESLIDSLSSFEDAATAIALKALKDGDNYQQTNAIALLGKLGPYARPAIPELRLIAKNPRHDLSQDAVRILKKIDH